MKAEKICRNNDFILRICAALTALVLVALLSVAETTASEPLIRSFVNKKKAAVGEKIKIMVEMEWEQSEGRSIEITHITPPSSALLEAAGSGQRTSSRLTENGVFAARILEYTYIARKKGTADIKPAVIEYTYGGKSEKRIIKTRPIHIKVVSRSAAFVKKLSVGALIMVFAALLSGAFIMLKKRIFIRKKKDIAAINGCTAQPEKKLCERMKELNKHRISGELGAYYAGIEDALVSYVREKYNVDLLTGAMKGLPEALQKICNEWKELSVKVRFSGYKPPKDEEERLVRETTKYAKSLLPADDSEDLVETVD